LRISLVGGGTDFPEFYNRHGGAVISFAISKYVYISVNEKYDGKTRVSYSHTETVEDVRQLEHSIARETLAFFEEKGLEITSVADVPGTGTGLGSSSAYTVGLIKALSARNGERFPPKMLAETAYTVEAKLCGHAVGKQDQYAAAYGGVHFFEFKKDYTSVEPIPMSDGKIKYIEDRMLLFHVDLIRNADTILSMQQERLVSDCDTINAAKKMTTIAYELREMLRDYGADVSFIGDVLHRNWVQKKKLSNGISHKYIDDLYIAGRNAGADGGKLCGAGGGGFMLFFAEPDKHEAIRRAVGLRQMTFKIEKEGCKVIYDSKA